MKWKNIRKSTAAHDDIHNAGFRKVVYTPPQDYKIILELMTNLERFINDESLSDLDPPVKMAIIQ